MKVKIITALELSEPNVVQPCQNGPARYFPWRKKTSFLEREKTQPVSNLIYFGLQKDDTTWEITTESWRRQGLGIKLQRSVQMNLAGETKLRNLVDKRDIMTEALDDLEDNSKRMKLDSIE